MSLALIAAITQNNCIGKNGTLPWYIPEDLTHFKKITTGKTVIMGRKTWESLPEKFRPLPKRKNVVISRQKDYPVPDTVLLFCSVEDATRALKDEPCIIIGGAELYRQTIDLSDTLYITHIDRTIDGDAFFPPIDESVWMCTEKEPHDGFAFHTYQRRTL